MDATGKSVPRGFTGNGLVLRLLLAVGAVLVAWIAFGPAPSASADERSDSSLLGVVGSVVSSTVDVVEAPVAALVPGPAPVPAPAPAPVAAPAPVVAPAPAPAPQRVTPVVQQVVSGVVAADVAGIVTPVVFLVDSTIAEVPVLDRVLGPTPVSSLTDPVVGLVDGVVDRTIDEVIDPIVAGCVPIVDLPVGTDPRPSLAGSVDPGVVAAAEAPAPVVTGSGVLSGVTIGTSPTRVLDDGVLDVTPGASSTVASSGSSPLTPLPVGPIGPGSPVSSATTAGSGASGSQMHLVTVDDDIRFDLASAGMGSATDDVAPASLTLDPGSSPD